MPPCQERDVPDGAQLFDRLLLSMANLANLAINELAFQTSEQEACKCLAYFLGQ